MDEYFFIFVGFGIWYLVWEVIKLIEFYGKMKRHEIDPMTGEDYY